MKEETWVIVLDFTIMDNQKAQEATAHCTMVYVSLRSIRMDYKKQTSCVINWSYSCKVRLLFE